MIMSNVISLHCERCDVGNARSLNAPSYRNARSDPYTGLLHYATVPGGKASLNDRARSFGCSTLSVASDCKRQLSKRHIADLGTDLIS
jgi:hypothetical protein